MSFDLGASFDLGSWLFDSSGLTAHGFCLLWQPGLIWTFALSDVGIALAYYSIPVALIVVARRRKDLFFRPLLWLFAAFILLCGTAHWLDVLTLWLPLYQLEAIVKAMTATVSVFSAIALWWLLPQALTLPSPAQMREANAALLASQEQLMQSQKMEAVGQLTGGIAHDFNNILQGLISALSLIERRIAQGRVGETERYIASMRRACDTAASLTSRLLAFSRRQALQPRAVNPDLLITGMEDLLRRTLGPSIRLDMQMGDGRWAAVCDPNQLESSILNLAINARDAMPTGGMLMITTADRVLTDETLIEGAPGPGNYVEIEVADTGTGIPPDVLARVFEPFFTTKPPGHGTGLGLSQVYGFARQSDGTVQIVSEPGRGTAVRLYLPGREARPIDSQGNDTPLRIALDTSETQKGIVLVVEDQKDVRMQISEALAEAGYTILEAEDGTAGLRLLQTSGRFDLLVTDVGLPGVNGRQLADAARAIMPRLPVLFITGYAGAAFDNPVLEPGMDILRKPFTFEELTARMRALLVKAEIAAP